ncbi:MAG: D-hexose-6-phosphate mutarotase [Rhodoferax sp.]|nr:D-hexose-6-phosphate mutarotase [Rhodoferax sp.]
MTKIHIVPDDVVATAPKLEHRALGAQVLQAWLGNFVSIFYLSPLSMGVPGSPLAAAPARGGVPVLFPQFADRGLLPKHGFVRTARWNLVEEQVLHDAHTLRYGLSIQPNDYPAWPHACELNLIAEAKPDALVFALQVRNSGADPFSWTGGLHPYFSAPDLLTCSALGLEGLGVQDRYDAHLQIESQGKLRWTPSPFERLYDACPPVILDMGNYSLLLSASGFDQWMIWNPGEAGAGALADLPAGDWRRFVCVEPVRVDRPVVLAPGETFDGHLRIQITERDRH